MNLIIDVGNTYVKLAVFKGNKQLSKGVVKMDEAFKKIQKIQKKYPEIEKAIISSVGKLEESVLNYVKEQLDLLVLDYNTPLPFKNCYETPKTLGIDRIALVCASVDQFPDKNVLIIDAGTCITYDFINSKNDYLGGAISPGLQMRYNALHNQTANLPLLVVEIPKNYIGNTTNSSIHSGILIGVLNEIDGFISQYEEKHADLTVILTGGNAKMLSKQLKSGIFANYNFLLEGLNYILQFNSN